MTVIDQRILIAASVEYVWIYLTESAYISKWNRGAKQLSVLTVRADGVGTRRRCVDTRGQSVVEEITAWLPPYGYEYQIVDGPFRSFTGRMRLQSVPDGTQIQWLVDYELRGVLGGLRNRFGYQRRMRLQLADSLRGLRRLIEASGVRLDREKQAKVAMQADPGFAARLARSGDPTRQGTVQSLPPEPIITVGDDDLPELPPEPVVSAPTMAATLEVEAPPSFITSVPTVAPTTAKTKPLNERRPAPLVDDTKPRPPAGLQDAIALTTMRPASATPETPPMPIAGQTTVSAALVAPRTPDPTTQTVAPLPRVLSDIMPPVAPPAAVEALPPSSNIVGNPAPVPPIGSADKAEKYDTGEMSIWDVFGLDRPSERNKAQLDQAIASLQTPLPGSLPPIVLPPLLPESDGVKVEAIITSDSTPPLPFEPMHPVFGRVDRGSMSPMRKISVAVRTIVAPQHTKATVKTRRIDR